MPDVTCKFKFLDSKDVWILEEGDAAHCDPVKPTDPPQPGESDEVSITVAVAAEGPGGGPPH